MTPNSMKKWQIRIFAACFLAYTAAYICRVNISPAIPVIQQDLELNSASMGLVGTAFFWSYALGQLINGYIGDRVSGRRLVFCGLVISALLNIAFGFSSGLAFMLLFWGVNGFFQSMLWGPIVKTFSKWFPHQKYNAVSFGLSISPIAGYLIAWGFSGIVLKYLNWRWVFWIPAALVMGLALLWLVMARNKPEDTRLSLGDAKHQNGTETTAEQANESASEKAALWGLIARTNLVLIALAGVTQGMIDKSIQLWFPKLLADTLALSWNETAGTILIIPLVNLGGIMLVGWLNKRLKFNTKLTIVLLMAASVISSLLLALFYANAIAGVVLIACTSAFIGGINPLMVTMIPLTFKHCDKVSAVAGFIDFSIYLGAGFGGTLTGYFLDSFGWNNVFLMWCLVLAIGTVVMGVYLFKEKANLFVTAKNK